MRHTAPSPVPLSSTPCWDSIPYHLKVARGLSGDEAAIQLSGGFWTIVSPEDIGQAAFLWSISRWGDCVYAVRTIMDSDGRKKKLRLHTIIINQPELEVDHLDQHILAPYRLLDNRRCNLRAVTPSENQANKRRRVSGSSIFKGVWWEQGRGKWRSRISKDYHRISLGMFETQEAAAAAYNSAHASLWPHIPEGRNTL